MDEEDELEKPTIAELKKRKMNTPIVNKVKD